MTTTYRKEKKITHIFQSDKNSQLWFCETWRKYNETGFSSTNWLSVLLFLAHTHSHTRVVSLMRYHFVIYHAAQQDVSPPLMHQRQQQFCPCLRSPSRLQQAQCCLAVLGSGGGERGRYTINDYTLPHCQTPLHTSLCAYVPPRSLYCISPLPVTLTRLDFERERSYKCRSKSKYCSVYISHLIRRNHSNRAVIKEQFRRCCHCLSPNEARLHCLFLP